MFEKFITLMVLVFSFLLLKVLRRGDLTWLIYQRFFNEKENDTYTTLLIKIFDKIYFYR